MSVIQFFIFVFCSHTPPCAETIPPTGSPRISISAVPSDKELVQYPLLWILTASMMPKRGYGET